MSNYHRYKQTKLNPAVISRAQADANRLPEQFSDYMKGADTRFSEICQIYLDCLTIDDLRFLQPEDLICLVPPEQHKHKLLMTIMVRKYLFRDDDQNGELDFVEDRDSVNVKQKHKRHHHNHTNHNHTKGYCSCPSCDSSSVMSD